MTSTQFASGEAFLEAFRRFMGPGQGRNPARVGEGWNSWSGCWAGSWLPAPWPGSLGRWQARTCQDEGWDGALTQHPKSEAGRSCDLGAPSLPGAVPTGGGGRTVKGRSGTWQGQPLGLAQSPDPFLLLSQAAPFFPLIASLLSKERAA